MRGGKTLADYPIMGLLIYGKENRGLEHDIRALAAHNEHKRFSIHPFGQPMEEAD